ncbi:MAG: ABC transporter permease subunit [Bacillota bacterium]|nr:ABC transporter permease subunit [Bacillota bacterium]
MSVRLTKNPQIPWLLLLPVLLLYGILIGAGLVTAFIESLGYIPALGLLRPSWDAYRSILQQSDFMKNTLFSIWIALVSSLLSTIFGVLIAKAISDARANRLTVLTRKSMQLGLILPYLYGIFLVMTFLGQAGYVSRILYHTGIIQEPRQFPALLYDASGMGMVLVFVFKGTPFVALFVSNILSRVSAEYQDVARTLGAGHWTVFRRIHLPLSSSVIVWCASVLFAYDLGSFEVPYLLAAIRPVTLSTQLYSRYISPDLLKIPQAMALSVLLFLIGFSCTALYAVILKKVLGGRIA